MENNKQMKLYNPLLIKTGSQEHIQYWESPEPNPNHYKNDFGGEFDKNSYDLHKESWLASSKTLDVHPSAVEELISFKGPLEGNGISLSGIEDRLEIKEECCKTGGCLGQECTAGAYRSFILKPIPYKEEETQDEFFELIDIIKEYLENRINAANCANQLKTKFNITRK